MASEWPLFPLDSLVDDILDRRGVTVRKLGADFAPSGHRVISAKLVKSGTIDLSADEPRFVDEHVYRRWMRTPLMADDVILTSEAPLGEVAYVREELDWCLGQRLFAIRTDKRRLNGRFLYYALQSAGVRRDLLSRATGTTAEGVRQSELRRVRIPVPPLPEQKRIAEMLGALDDKIDLNRRMSQTVESMARALFKSWFVDFDPVRAKSAGRDPGLPPELAGLFAESFEESQLGPIPRGWRIAPIHDLANVVGGSTPSTTDDSFWENGSHLWATPKDLSALRSPVLLSTERRITDAGLAQIGSGLLSLGTVLLSSRAPIGYLAVAEAPVAINQGFIAMQPRSGVPSLFLLYWAEWAQDEIVSRANGSTFLEISKAQFRAIPVRVPPPGLFAAFNSHMRPLHARVVANVLESRALEASRNRLLPSLMSGELPPGRVTPRRA